MSFSFFMPVGFAGILRQNHTRYRSLRTNKQYSAPYYGQSIIIMYAILLYEQFMTIMLSYISIYDLVFTSCSLHGDPPGLLLYHSTVGDQFRRIFRFCRQLVWGRGNFAIMLIVHFIKPFSVVSFCRLFNQSSYQVSWKINIKYSHFTSRFTWALISAEIRHLVVYELLSINIFLLIWKFSLKKQCM